MITTGSKFAYALAALLAVSAVVYGWTTDGSFMGALSVGYKGGVGDHVGYTILLFGAALAAFVGFALTAFRDADPAAAESLTGVEPGPVPSPGPSYWPAVGAVAIGYTVVGAAVNNVFFVAGLIALGAVAIEWTMQAWADRATGDPAVNREIRNRIMLPLEAPIGGALAAALVIGGFSRVFLTASADVAVFAALAFAALIFGIGTLLSMQKHLRKDVVVSIVMVASAVVIGLGIFGAIRGEREFEHHGDTGADHADESGDEHVEESN